MDLNNFLTSGHQFNDEEYEIKSKFILLNSMIAVTLFAILSLITLLFINHKMEFAYVNCIYLIIGVYAVFFMRFKKENHKKVVYLIPLISIPLVVTALIYYPTEQIRIAWFLIIIIASFFLGGKKLGLVVAIISILTIISLYFLTDVYLSEYILMLSIVILFLGSIVVYLYEIRQEGAKKRLYAINMSLEQRVKKEIEKRMGIYKKSAQELEEQKNSYKKLAFYDTLTGLPNRVLFYDRLKHSIEISKRNKRKIAVMFLDLDAFKEINDSLGHHVGDEILKIIAKRLETKIRKSDTLARLGGDEFTLLLEEITNPVKIAEIAQSLIEIVSKPIIIKGHELYVTVSVGVSIYPDDAQEIDGILKCADAAMYSAKKEGCNLTHFYKKVMTDESLEKLKLETSMRYALKNNEFVIYYQPIFDSNQNSLIGLEALVRWQHPTRGLLAPKDFIEVAESSALIVELGADVLQKVSEQVQNWHEKRFNPGFVSVNLSVRQLRHSGLLSTLSDILKRTSFTSSWLELEITEGYAMKNPNEAINLLNQIKELGIKLAIDDFGTGYSSLSYLKKLPVDKLKIDRSFINDIGYNNEDRVLVSAIVSMAESMNLDVVAEGVETQEQKELLENLGCSKMQGYFFDKPMTSVDIEKKYIHQNDKEVE